MIDTKKDKSEIVVQLSDKITVQKSGEQLFSNKMTLKAPSAVHMTKLCTVKQIVMRAVKTAIAEATATQAVQAKAIQSQPSSDAVVSDADQAVLMLYMNASSEDMICVMNGFRELLFDGCGLVEGVVVTDYVINQLLVKDIEHLLGEYIVNFIVPS